jgi:hypothetical protein
MSYDAQDRALFALDLRRLIGKGQSPGRRESETPVGFDGYQGGWFMILGDGLDRPGSWGSLPACQAVPP